MVAQEARRGFEVALSFASSVKALVILYIGGKTSSLSVELFRDTTEVWYE